MELKEIFRKSMTWKEMQEAMGTKDVAGWELIPVEIIEIMGFIEEYHKLDGPQVTLIEYDRSQPYTAVHPVSNKEYTSYKTTLIVHVEDE